MVKRTKKSTERTYTVSIVKQAGIFAKIADATAAKARIKSAIPGVRVSAAKKVRGGYVLSVSWMRVVRSPATAAVIKAAVQKRTGKARVSVSLRR